MSDQYSSRPYSIVVRHWPCDLLVIFCIERESETHWYWPKSVGES